ncbi:MAG TPA: hypothetical protein VFS21_01940 [Roseiflexaceae bacterium]|nr:hypothetical protein [Roseiflexaceae bacterium]
MRSFVSARWARLLAGLALFGIGIALMVRSRLGLSPWEVLHQGITLHTGIPIGTVSIAMGLPLLLLWLPLGQRPGWGTLLNIVLIGLITDLSLLVLPATESLAARAALVTVGIAMIGLGSGLYLGADMGAGPRDGLMMGLARRTGLSVRLIRTAIELSVLAAGWLMGGTVGIGTVAFALGIGPVVQQAMRMLGLPPKKPVPAVAQPVMRNA